MSTAKTQTEQNLRTALEGESLARNKYTFYAMAARRAGHVKVADTLERLAQNEMMHAKFWFEKLYGTPDDTRANLKWAIEGELKEAGEMYPGFAAQARADGDEGLAAMFESVARIERDHAAQFMRLLQELDKPAEPDRAASQEPAAPPKVLREGYRCMFCGAVYPDRPDTCGVCQAIGSFELCRYEE